RGETQSLSTVTLGTKLDEQVIDGAVIEGTKNFLLHYNFPGFATGEVKGNRGLSRREVGHGNLAWRALKHVIPTGPENPYTIRVVSDILESNGSSSMATVCAGTLALMDAGVKISKPVTGIAMGLISKGDKWAVLSDILGDEDHLGDMDFKVAGTRTGVTALQMDNKAGGITREILEEALMQARKARMEILDKMEAASPTHGTLSPTAPRIVTFNIDPEKIRDVIGPGGKIIRGITQQTGVKMNVEDSGQVTISGPTQAQVDQAQAIVMALTKELQAGEVYHGTVTRLMNFGAFVECLPGKEGLLHVSEISTSRVPRVEDVFKPGDRVLVMVKEIDEQGRVNLTRRRLLANEDKVHENGLGHVLPDEHERDDLIVALAAREPVRDHGYGDRGYGERSFGSRSYGDRDRGYGDRNRGYGDRDRGYGDRDRGYGDRDRGGRDHSRSDYGRDRRGPRPPRRDY
ncbi:MAG: polyribonucleotide nucleotidyltransferase, partial [Synergistaceae bacterium]|nr:polyribonucleotide nucleotidyltransferase [Synergistaceae bacterium]